MTAAYRAVVADRKDVQVITIVCEDCGAEISVDAISAKMPYWCPSCERQYDQNVRDALAALGRFHRLGAAAEEHAKKSIFRFTIKQGE